MGSPPLEFLTGKIVSLIENEVSLLGGVRDQLEEIKNELVTMKAFMADAERKAALTEVEKTWLESVRIVSIDVEDIIEEFTYHLNKQRSWDPYTRAFRRTICFPKNYWEKRRMATKLQKIIGKIKAIPESKKRYGVERIEGMTASASASQNYDPNRVKMYGESSIFLKDDELVGIQNAKEKLVGWLMSGQPQRSLISVVGMGGSGKTTLVANTFNSPTVKQHFNCHAWINVSQTFNFQDLLRVMIIELFGETKEDVPQDLSNMSYQQLVQILINYLQPKRYVIVLDDVWDINLWRDISKALPDGTNGSRVMLTTRNNDIAKSSYGVRCHIHHVQPLTDTEAWELFSRKAFSSWPDSCCPPTHEHIARNLVAKCQGLPLGIAALGALMSAKENESEWKIVYDSLNWELSNNPTLEVVKSILLLSFNDLPYRLKHCFLYFCIFPEDYVIGRNRLIRLWLAEGFVQLVPGAKLEKIAESYIEHLTCRCMLQVVKRRFGRAQTFKMHDLLRELALSISENFCAVFNTQEANEECRSRAPHRLSLLANYGELRTHEDLSKVRTFFTFATEMIDSSFEKLPSGFKLLRVMDFKRVPIAQLPNEIVKFYNLKYLNLKGTMVKELPRDIGKLHNLESLDIRHSKIRLLPAGIVKLKNLRHLLMYHHNVEYTGKSFDCYLSGTQAPFNICKLKNLQVLDGIELGGVPIKQLQQMTQLTRFTLSNVREADEKDLCKSIECMKLIELLDIKTSNEGEVLHLDALPSAPPLLKRLGLAGKLQKIPVWFQSLQSLTFLHLFWSRLTEDFLPHIETLSNLTKLHLNNTYVGNQLVFHTGFQSLTDLQLNNFPQLNMVIIERGAMPALQRLEIVDCMELKELSGGIFEHLKCLETLYFIRVSDELIDQIFGKGSLGVKGIANCTHVYKNQDWWWGKRW